jgi:serine/threonine protein kinase
MTSPPDKEQTEQDTPKRLSEEELEVLSGVDPEETIWGRSRHQHKSSQDTWDETLKALPSRRSVLSKIKRPSEDGVVSELEARVEKNAAALEEAEQVAQEDSPQNRDPGKSLEAPALEAVSPGPEAPTELTPVIDEAEDETPQQGAAETEYAGQDPSEAPTALQPALDDEPDEAGDDQVKVATDIQPAVDEYGTPPRLDPNAFASTKKSGEREVGESSEAPTMAVEAIEPDVATMRGGSSAAHVTDHFAGSPEMTLAKASDIQADLPTGTLADMKSLQSGNADFVLQKLIGKGGQGEVWEAWQSSLRRLVAVKCLMSGDISEFLQEAYTSGELDHPNIVPVYDLGRIYDGEKEQPLLAMKKVQGSPWNELLKADRKDEELKKEAFLIKHLRILVDVCNAVAYAHSKGIIHRDLKPSQVMVGQFGEVFLMDWGLAVYVESDMSDISSESLPKFSTLKTASNRCGSPAYMAPEQTMETTTELGFWTDIYLLGAILFELAVGKPPHASETAEGAYFMAVLNEFCDIPDDIPGDIHRLMFNSLSTDPVDRPESATAFRDALEDYLSGASRQRESREMVEVVKMSLAEVDLESLDYGHVAQLTQRLSRALQLWPENSEAEEVRQRLLGRHAQLAFEAGDLQLAYSLAGSLADDLERMNLLREIGNERKKKERVQRQRRVLMIASQILTLIVLIGSAFYYVREARAETERLRREAEIEKESARLELYSDRYGKTAELLEMAEERAELVESVLDLTAEEVRLANILAEEMALPQTLLVNEAEKANELDRKRALELTTLRNDLASQRIDLLVQGAPIPKEPLELFLGQANLFLKRGSLENNALYFKEATDLYFQARELYPEHPSPLQGLGITAARNGSLTSATVYLNQATDLARDFYGSHDIRYAQAVSLESQAVELQDANDPRVTELQEQVVEILAPEWSELTEMLSEGYDVLGETTKSNDLKDVLWDVNNQ